MALRGVAGTNALMASRRLSKDMAAARLACDDAYDAGLGGAALEEESDGGGSDSRLDIQCVLTPFSAYMRQADWRTGTSCSATTCPSSAQRALSLPTRGPASGPALPLSVFSTFLSTTITFAFAAPPKNHGRNVMRDVTRPVGAGTTDTALSRRGHSLTAGLGWSD
jgi:hypothetical protein